MKKLLTLLFTALIICSFAVKENFTAFNIVGKWESTAKNEENSGFIFESDGSAFMFKDIEKIGGKDFEINGTKGSMKYVTDGNSNPIKLDIIITLKSKKVETKKMLMLIKIIDNNTINIAVGENEAIRAIKFTKSNTIQFIRSN